MNSNFFNIVKQSIKNLLRDALNNNFRFSNVIYYIIFISIFLFISPIIIYFCLNKNNTSNEEFNLHNKYIVKESKQIPYSDTIEVFIQKNNKSEEIDLEKYICSVLASEMPVSFEIEALKAQAIAARTYALSKQVNKCTKSKGSDICDTVHCQVYVSKEEKIKSWGKNGEENWNKIVQAVNETKGIVMEYNDELILNPQFFAISSGKTENNKDVFNKDIPYLKSVDSPGEEIAPKFKSTVKIDYSNFANKINLNYKKANLKLKNIKNQIKILERTKGGMVKKIKLGDVSISGVDFRKIFNINSANFNIKFSKNNIEILCRGYGHGVGMSQWGANVMAKKGDNFNKILTHYYSGVNLVNIYK